MTRVGVDIDDVLFPWYDRAHTASVRAGITTPNNRPTTWWPYREYGCEPQAWYDALAVATLDGTLYAGDPFPGAVDALHRIAAAGHTIHLVTARGFLAHGPAIKAQTIAWLDEHQVPHDTLTFSRDKTVVPCDWFVDDNVDNATAVAATGTRAYLLRQPWNQHNQTLPAVQDVPEFARIVLEEARRG